MKKNNLINLLDEIFIPLGFERKQNDWIFENDTLLKVVNLQKSNYGSFFYINYGYIIKSIKLTTSTHVENRLASINKEEQQRITELLDIENDISIDERRFELKKLIIDKIVTKIQSVNTEEDILDELKKRPQLNNIPLVVKKHFNLE